MKNIWSRICRSEWFATVLKILLVVIAFTIFSIIGTLIDVWFVHFMKDTFGINVYWTLH